MTQRITLGRMFELTNQTFGKHFLYILTLAGIFVAVSLLTTVAAISISKGQMNGTLVFLMLMMVVVYAKLAVMIHRLVILQESGLSHLFKWTVNEIKFVGWILLGVVVGWLILYTVIKFGMSPGSHSSGPGGGPLLMLVVLLVLGLIFSRMALIFPATAVGHPFSLSDSWKLSSHHKFTLFMLVVLVPYVTSRILQQLPDEHLMISLVGEVISVLVIIYEVGLLSHCYEALTQTDEADADMSESS